jgi:hypothetical protein
MYRLVGQKDQGSYVEALRLEDVLESGGTAPRILNLGTR